MANLFIFGLGYTASRIAEALRKRDWTTNATGSSGNVDFGDGDAVVEALRKADWVLSSVPPDKSSGSDPVLEEFGDHLASSRLIYLSSTGVYGDAQGAWVDENSPTGTGRRSARSECDSQWMDAGARVMRLPGIYGPDRSALDRVREGKARRIDMPGQVFSRVHVDDIVSGILAVVESDAAPGAYNLADDLPSSGNAVTEEACRLMGVEPPPVQTIEEAGLSEMAKGFYSENRRVANGKAKRVLGWKPHYPTYREGLRALNAMSNPASASTAPDAVSTVQE